MNNRQIVKELVKMARLLEAKFEPIEYKEIPVSRLNRKLWDDVKDTVGGLFKKNAPTATFYAFSSDGDSIELGEFMTGSEIRQMKIGDTSRTFQHDYYLDIEDKKLYRSEVKVAKLIASTEEDLTEKEMLDIMQKLASKVGYKLDKHPMRSTIGTAWTIRKQSDYLEIYVYFGTSVKVDISVLPLDEFHQEPIVDEQVDSFEFDDILNATKRVIAKALKSDLLKHLKMETGLN